VPDFIQPIRFRHGKCVALIFACSSKPGRPGAEHRFMLWPEIWPGRGPAMTKFNSRPGEQTILFFDGTYLELHG
jgi:hypothetical protein